MYNKCRAHANKCIIIQNIDLSRWNISFDKKAGVPVQEKRKAIKLDLSNGIEGTATELTVKIQEQVKEPIYYFRFRRSMNFSVKSIFDFVYINFFQVILM